MVSEEVRRRITETLGLYCDPTPPSRQFPKGLRYRYFRAAKRGRSREWWCAWTTTRNANGKFASYVMEWTSDDTGRTVKFREHAKRKDAKARATELKLLGAE